MTDFGRVPILEVEQPAKEEKEIFDKPTAKQVEPSNAETEKKLKLKEHLARCREKSAVVRKAKATEKKKNKRPVGRPKKVKDPMNNIKMVVEPETIKEEPLDTIQEDAEDKTEVEIFKQKDKLIQVLETPELIPPPVPKAQPAFEIWDLIQMF